MEFAGNLVALVTPFDNGEVDRDALVGLVERAIGGGVAGLVPCCTTGESPTLSHSEHDRVIALTCEAAGGRVPVVAGTGSNSTAEAARALHDHLYPVMQALFVDTNPIPVKAALADAGRIGPELRLPLCPMPRDRLDALRAAFAPFRAEL